MQPERQRSLWWILLPIFFFEIIGGVIAYFILRQDDPRLAKFCLQLGILLTAIHLVFLVIIFSTIGLTGLEQDFAPNI